MDMAARFQEQFVFHLTGRRHGAELEAVDGMTLRPALLAGFGDLAGLRHDFPVVLVANGAQAGPVRSLSGVVDEVLRDVAPRGIEGERLRKDVLRLERELRTLVAQGANGSLSDLWAMAATRIGSAADDTAGKVLGRTGAALTLDGEVLPCTHAMPARLLAHLWKAVQARKAGKFHADADALAVKLSEILRAAFVHSAAGRRADSLKASVGAPHHEIFDFAAMSKLLGEPARRADLPESRRKRIEWALAVLRSQRFFAPSEGRRSTLDAGTHEFQFDNCAGAVAAFRERLPQVVELAKAMSIAALETDGRYVEEVHDPLFAEFGPGSLEAADLAAFPDYLVCIAPERIDAPGNAALMETLSAGLPVKVMVQIEDVLDESSLGEGHLVFGAHGAQLASTAIGLDDVFVLQSSSSNLYQLRQRVEAGLSCSGPALFSVFSGPAAQATLPPYLTAAAAMQARAFPAFSCDPAAGTDWASRFSLDGNPQPEADWPVDQLAYSDEQLQRVTEKFPFTIADFAATDPRHAGHFAKVPRSHWNADMVGVDEWLNLDAKDQAGKVPYVPVIDDDDVLHRLVVDRQMMQVARRCREMWHRLQELGGIHNSHAERLLAREKAAWEEKKQREMASLKIDARSAPTAPAAMATAAVAVEAAQPAKSSDEPYIETARCSTCNECTQINDRMFAYNDNKQAYIADADAGTYRELVEAAESCQLAIIHPGKPRNPGEPGLEELIKRAEPFG